MTTPITTPISEIDQLRQQNALLLKRLLIVSRQRDELAKQLAAVKTDGAQ
jgi:hypothetical protein